MPRVVHFEIHATNPEKAIPFYEQIFGWQFGKWNGPEEYWLILTGPDGQTGINGGLMRRRGPAPAEGQPVNSYVCTIEVPALDEFLGQVTSSGGTVAAPKMAIPGVGWLAYAKDPDGNIFGMMQPDTTAK